MMESSVMTRDFKVQTNLRRLETCGPVCVNVCTVFVVSKEMLRKGCVCLCVRMCVCVYVYDGPFSSNRNKSFVSTHCLQ